MGSRFLIDVRRSREAGATAPGLFARTKTVERTFGGGRDGVAGTVEVEVPTRFGRMADAVSGAVKSYAASLVNAGAALYQGGQGGRSARDSELLAEYRAEAARAELELEELLAMDGLSAREVLAGGQMAGDAALAAVTGGSALIPLSVRSFGGGAQEARQSGRRPPAAEGDFGEKFRLLERYRDGGARWPVVVRRPGWGGSEIPNHYFRDIGKVLISGKKVLKSGLFCEHFCKLTADYVHMLLYFYKFTVLYIRKRRRYDNSTPISF